MSKVAANTCYFVFVVITFDCNALLGSMNAQLRASTLLLHTLVDTEQHARSEAPCLGSLLYSRPKAQTLECVVVVQLVELMSPREHSGPAAWLSLRGEQKE